LSVDRCQELEAGLTADRVKPVTWGSLHARETLLFFQPTVNCILNVINHNPDIPFNNLNSKIIYNVFISEITVLPKIFTKNLLPNPKLYLSYLVSPFISPPTKEHLFLTLHNLLLTSK